MHDFAVAGEARAFHDLVVPVEVQRAVFLSTISETKLNRLRA